MQRPGGPRSRGMTLQAFAVPFGLYGWPETKGKWAEAGKELEALEGELK